ncbi:MAG: VOC family protein [Pseudoxanthomonas sp.]|nr:VOC family protein [Pseudoxanthomonas sp.]
MPIELYAYLCVADTARAIAFYAQAFGAREKFRLVEPSGRIGHAEVEIGGQVLMLCDPFPEFDLEPPAVAGRAGVTLHLHVDDADAVVARALAAGATLEREVADAFYGERGGAVVDPFGHRWLVGHSIEEVTPEEMQRRYTALFR